MEDFVKLLFGPLGCIVGMAVCMAMMALRTRRPKVEPDSGPADEDVPTRRAEVARLRAQRAVSESE